MANRRKQELHPGAPSRRDLFKTGALLGGGALAASGCPFLLGGLTPRVASALGPHDPYELSQPENVLYTTCLQCNTGCEIKVKLLDGVAAKIDGSPYGPRAMPAHLPYSTSPQVSAKIDGVICPKGQAGIQTHYDPYRVIKVLKRAGPRGSHQWRTISFEQAVREIVEGGKLFADLPGEEGREVEGMKALWALRDGKAAKQLAADVEKISKKEMTVAELKAKHAAYLGSLIDPEHPDLGPKNNQVVMLWGRLKAGRSEFITRFFGESFGTVNRHGHTTVCQGSLYFAGKAMSDQLVEGKWTGGSKAYWMADTENAEFLLYIGASPLEANYGPPFKAPRIAESIAQGRLKLAVVDPRCSKAAAKAWKWLPAKPGSEAALALGMMRWMFEHERFDSRFLANANKAAAQADGEPSYVNACWLVAIDEKGRPGAFLRATEAKLLEKKEQRKTAEGKEWELDPLVVMKDGKGVPFDPHDEKNPVEGDLWVDAELGGLKVKSVLTLLKETAFARSPEEWAEICGVSAAEIAALAKEFTSHGKKAVCEPHRGVSQHTNGFYNVVAAMTLNMLIGNMDWKGGLIKGGGTYDQVGEKEGKPFKLKGSVPGNATPFGLDIIRHAKYETSTLFQGYPAKRPWYPHSSDVYQEVIPAAGDAYPYPIKALFLYMGTPVYSLPAGDKQISILTDTKKIPLFVASDIGLGETSMFADYVFPDLSYLERWEFHGSHPCIPHKVSPVRQPVVGPVNEVVKVFDQEVPISFEALLLAMAEKMGLPGFGPNGFGEGKPLTRPEDFYLKMVADIATGDKPGEDVPEADNRELELFLKARRHLPKSVFDPERWKAAVGDGLWRKVVYLLNRGGRFEAYEKAWEGPLVKHRLAKLVNIYMEKIAKSKDSMTGKALPGHAVYQPVMDSLGRPIEDKGAFQLITHREISSTKSRTVSDYWLLGVLPEGQLVMSRLDAQRLGLKSGDRVRVRSASNPEGAWDLGPAGKRAMVGRVKVIEGIRPGVVSFPLGFGHWAQGASAMVIDGVALPADPRRSRGIHANAAMRADPHLQNVTLSDPVGGSAVFYDTRVEIERA